MKKSDSIKNLAVALINAQSECGNLPFDGKNDFTASKYTTLGAVIDITKPVLKRHGLVFTCLPTGDGDNVGVTYLLMHAESGEWIEETLISKIDKEPKKSLGQVAGSNISYFRRYGISALLNLYSDEDRDGNRPMQKKSTPRKNIVQTSGNQEGAPALTPQYLVDNELSSNIPHAGAIINNLQLVGKKATPEALAKIKRYREFKDGGMGDSEAFRATLNP